MMDALIVGWFAYYCDLCDTTTFVNAVTETEMRLHCGHLPRLLDIVDRDQFLKAIRCQD
jgi:hypothetical protein